MIIGITGENASGKDTVANILEEKGFIHYSLSDILREELRKRNKEVIRENLINIGNELRKKYSPSILADETIKKLEPNKDYVITSIRNPEEINSLLKQPNFNLIYINAPLKLRYKRYKKEKISFEQFVKEDKKENSKGKHEQQLNSCKKLATIEIVNNSTLEKLQEKVNNVITYLKKDEEYVRPSWDEYFLNLCSIIGSRGTCDRGRAGCVIVKNKRIVATGYVGSPSGISHCDEIGHEMKSIIHEDGSISKHCVRTAHAEQNAICLAARYGIPIEGTTLYCKMTPCYICAKMIINTGIKRVVCKKDYHASKDTKELFKKAKINLEIVDKTIEEYKNQ